MDNKVLNLSPHFFNAFSSAFFNQDGHIFAVKLLGSQQFDGQGVDCNKFSKELHFFVFTRDLQGEAICVPVFFTKEDLGMSLDFGVNSDYSLKFASLLKVH